MDDKAADGGVCTRQRHPAFSGVCKPAFMTGWPDRRQKWLTVPDKGKSQTASAVLPNQDGKVFGPVLAHGAGDFPFNNDKAAARQNLLVFPPYVII